MAKKFLNKKLVSGAMAALMLSSVMQLPVLASDDSVDYTVTETYSASVSTRSVGTILNFSHSGSTAERSVGIANLIAQSTGTSVSSQEAAYLASEGISLVYDEGLSSSLVSVSVSGDSTIAFTANASTYRAYNGSSIRWTPVSATLDGKTVNFESSAKGYTASFSGLVKDKVYTATFQYQTTITVSSYTLSSVVNYAYDKAQEVLNAEARYEQEMEAYNNALVSYQTALKNYETLYAQYQAYQQALKEYNAELSAYNAYVKKVAAYEEAMKTYNAYLENLATYDERYAAYEAELAALPEKQAEYEKYLEYLALMDAAMQQLAVLDSCFITDSTGRSMYATLMGDTVDAVLANKSALVAAGVDAKAVDNAGSATAGLRGLLADYLRCTTAEQRLDWYHKNYSALKSNFVSLYTSLQFLGDESKNRAVTIYLANNGKLDRYCQFVSQLYIISTGLDDSTTFNSNYTYNGRRLVDLVEPCQRINDTNTYSPSTTTLPEKMDPVEKPTVPVAPQKPTAVSEPLKTWTEDLSHPGDAPAVVTVPTKPQLSDFTSGMPQLPTASAQLRAVVDLVRSNQLTYRSGALQDVNVTFDTSFSKAVSISSNPVVTFYDYDGKTVLYSTQVQKGGNAVYGGVTPTREADAQYTYIFAGWTDANGNDVGLYGVTANLSLYAKYTQKLNEYTVIWNVAGERVQETYTYGSTPSYHGKLSYQDGQYHYAFAGWSPSVSKVTGNAEYTARYTTSKLENLTFGVTFEIRGETYYRTYTYGEMPNFSDFEKDYVWGGYRYVFTGWSPELSEVTEDTKYVANFEKVHLIPAGENGNKSAEMTVTKTAHIVTTDETVVNAVYAVREALKAGTQLVLELGGATVTIDNANLNKISNAAYFRVTPSGALSWSLSVTDEAGSAIPMDAELLVEFPISDENENGGRLNAYVNDSPVGVTIQDGTAYVRLSDVGTVSLRPYYAVSVLTEGNGDMVAASENAEENSLVNLITHLEQGWEIDSLTISVNGADAEPLALVNGAFTMPRGDVIIRAVFAEADYEVVFMADGLEISRKTYRYGDIVEIPDMTENLILTKDKVTYTFSGWDSEVSAVKGDVVYTAVYTEGDGADDFGSDYRGNVLFNVVLPIFGVIFTLGIAALIFLVVRKKKYGKGVKGLGGDISRWFKTLFEAIRKICGFHKM